MTPYSLTEAIGPRTRAVIVTHLFGNAADIGPIVELCRARRIAVIEDCAQALGATIDGQRVGTFGDVGTYSFYPTKNLGAAGDGGAVSTRDAAIADSIRSLRQYGWAGKYRIAVPGGFNSRLDELQAAILRVGLPRLDAGNERRRAIVRHYSDAIAGTPVRLVTGSTPSSVAHLAVVRTGSRAMFQSALATAGIGSDVHYPIPDHQQPGLPRPSRDRALPETERAADEVLTVPCFAEMTDTEVERVGYALRDAAVA